MFKRLATALYLRRLSRDLTALSASVERQNGLLARLADRFAPLSPPAETAAVRADRADTGVSFLDPVDAALAQTFAARTLKDTGHLPDDDEVLIYLGDEQTTDLHQRLIARALELERLQTSRESRSS